MMAIKKIYTSTAEAAKQQEKEDKDDSHSDTLRDKLKRRVSEVNRLEVTWTN